MKHFTFVQTRDVDNVTADYDQELHDLKIYLKICYYQLTDYDSVLVKEFVTTILMK